jgi:hypothetical protein
MSCTGYKQQPVLPSNFGMVFGFGWFRELLLLFC